MEDLYPIAVSFRFFVPNRGFSPHKINPKPELEAHFFLSRHKKKKIRSLSIYISFSLQSYGRHEQRDERVHERRALASEVSKETTARTGIIISSSSSARVFVFVKYCCVLFLFVLNCA